MSIFIYGSSVGGVLEAFVQNPQEILLINQLYCVLIILTVPILLILLGTIDSVELDQGGWVELLPLTGLCTPLTGPSLCVSVTQEIGTQHNHILYTTNRVLLHYTTPVKVIKTDRYTKLL